MGDCGELCPKVEGKCSRYFKLSCNSDSFSKRILPKIQLITTSAASIIKTTSFNGTAIAGQTSDNKMNSINTNGIETENPDGSIYYSNLLFIIL